jgi:hypothetical protein
MRRVATKSSCWPTVSQVCLALGLGADEHRRERTQTSVSEGAQEATTAWSQARLAFRQTAA